MNFAQFHPYVYYATAYPFSKSQTSISRICYASSLYLISEGKGILHTNGRSYEALPGSLFYIPSGQLHDWIADDHSPMVHICCYFDWHYIDRQSVFEFPSIICYNPLQLKPALIGPSFPYPISEYSKVESLRVWIDWFQSFYTSNEFTSEKTFMRNIQIQRNFQGFIEYFLTFALHEDNVPDPRIYKTLEQMEHDILNGCLHPLEVYYHELRISRGYFFEMFKKATGFSPNQYILHFRLSRAKYDLRFSQLSITEIAEKHQFSTVHYFSRIFRKFAGQSPSEFRDSYDSIPIQRSLEIKIEP
ncbi:AraC family transcriptional regulator [Paenibacillus sp. KQZ6P-2]|uniref:AraC family transcriptional regulator n=1 Tax=Paenibacillus mangrovi TaxID=2931978 RepID=A0A9X2B4E1_9BACL|nr:AraC family transcriptional regulator [Paenibacillus mangrovi]MCJ8011537.1 AraC family transcriptional regulator [Paenibacillus mangrovi]